MRILHFAVDEKYIPFVQNVYEEAFPGGNRFRVVRNRAGGGGFVREGADARFVTRGYWFSDELDRDLAWADCLVVHFLSRRFARALLRAPANLLVAWHGWGKDYYGLLHDYAGRLYLPLTQRYLDAEKARRRWRLPGRKEVRRALVQLVDDVVYRDALDKALARVDVVSMLPAEFELLKRSHPQVRARFHQLYYSSAEATFAPGPARMTGRDILLGNSASPTNNHFEAIDALRRLDVGDRRIVVPLSYGDAAYADHIEREGRRAFGDRFVALRGFLPLRDYIARISACGFAFMNHVRQQATGNVSIALLKGAKVFLREENLLTPFYRDMGATVHRFPDAAGDLDAATVFTPLDETTRARNREVVMRYWSHRTIVDSARALADLRRAA